MIALSYSTGQISIISEHFQTEIFRFEILHLQQDKRTQAKSLAWFPSDSYDHLKWILIGACADGGFFEWSPSMEKTPIRTNLNLNNDYCTIDYNNDGSRFIIGGCLPQIEVLDGYSNSIVHIYQGMANFHNKSIQKIQFYPNSEHLFYSGGSDASIKFWDLRQDRSTIKIYGVQIASDAIDMHVDQNTVVIGGETEGIQIWDIRRVSEPIGQILYYPQLDKDYLIRSKCIKFIPFTDMLIAGVVDDIPAKCFNMRTGQELQSFSGLQSECLNIDVSSFSHRICLNDSKGKFQLFSYPSQEDEEFEFDFTNRKNATEKILSQFLDQKVKANKFVWTEPVEIKRPVIVQQSPEINTTPPMTIENSDQQFQEPSEQEQIIDNLYSMKTGQYDLTKETDQLSLVRKSGKQKLQAQVTQTETSIISQYLKKAEIYQLLTSAEIENAIKEEIVTIQQSSHTELSEVKNDTQKFIEEVEKHLGKSKIVQTDIQKISEQLQQQLIEEKPLGLPVIKGRIKNLKLLLQSDLKNDGIIQPIVYKFNQNQKYSSQQLSRRSSQINLDSQIVKYQRDMVVELPDEGDKVAENFGLHFRTPTAQKRFSVSTSRNNIQSRNNTIIPTPLSQRRHSFLPQITKIPEYVQKRIPDSDHLSQLRVYLMDAHKNLNFVKELTEGAYIPPSVKFKLDQEDQESFLDLMTKRKETLKQNQRKKDLIDNQLDYDSAYGSESNDTIEEEEDKIQVEVPVYVKEEEQNPIELEFQEAIRKGDLKTALNIILNQKELMSKVLTQFNISKKDAQIMKNNQFFKKYTANYQNQLFQILKKNFGDKLNLILKVNKNDPTFQTKINKFLGEKNILRKKMPDVFVAEYDKTPELNEMLKKNFQQVSVPPKIRIQVQANQYINSLKVDDPLKDTKYVRRLKMANYGKWFLPASKFTKKVQLLNEELKNK